MLDKTSFHAAYERAFPNAGGLPANAAALEQQILKARQGTITAELVVFDRLVAGMGNARLEQFLGASPAVASERTRQEAAKLSGHGDARAAFRFIDVPQSSALAQIVTHPGLREIVSAQILRAARQPVGKAMFLYQNCAVFTGSVGAAKAAAHEYAEGLAALGMVKSASVADASLGEGDNIQRFSTGYRQADLVQRIGRTFDAFKAGNDGVLFFDISQTKAWREEPQADPRTGPALLATLAHELVLQLSDDREGRVVLACDSESLRALCTAESGLAPRLANIIKV